VIYPGQYQYPFQYPLPTNLPGAFEKKGGDFEKGTGYKAKVLRLLDYCYPSSSDWFYAIYPNRSLIS